VTEQEIEEFEFEMKCFKGKFGCALEMVENMETD